VRTHLGDSEDNFQNLDQFSALSPAKETSDYQSNDADLFGIDLLSPIKRTHSSRHRSVEAPTSPISLNTEPTLTDNTNNLLSVYREDAQLDDMKYPPYEDKFMEQSEPAVSVDISTRYLTMESNENKQPPKQKVETIHSNFLNKEPEETNTNENSTDCVSDNEDIWSENTSNTVFTSSQTVEPQDGLNLQSQPTNLEQETQPSQLLTPPQTPRSQNFPLSPVWDQEDTSLLSQDGLLDVVQEAKLDALGLANVDDSFVWGTPNSDNS